MDRYATLKLIQTLDPQVDHQRICYLLVGYEFPWDITRALELALLRTFCVPSIAKLLDRTGEFQHRPQKRYDDTGLIVSAMLKWGYDHSQGVAFLQRMNAMHNRYAIANQDFLYVLSTFIYEPIRWCDRFGWRPFCEVEKQACYYFWQTVGDRMGIADIPPDYASFERFNQVYETEHFQYHAANQRVADSTLEMMLAWFPAPLRPLLKPNLYALLDPPLRQALGWPTPPAPLQTLVSQSLRWRSGVLRQLPPRQQADFFVDHRHRSYPEGFTLKQLGPPSLLDELNCDEKQRQVH